MRMMKRTTSLAQPELRAAIQALDMAGKAQKSRSKAKRAKAQAALSAARDGLKSVSVDDWFREVQSGQWSDARARALHREIQIAAAGLESEEPNVNTTNRMEYS